MDFTENIAQIKAFIAKVQADGGGDAPEDVVGGMRHCLDLSWTAGSKRQVFHICDAPEHGLEFSTGFDRYPNGSPNGLKIPPLMQEFHSKNIAFTFVKLNDSCEKMIKVMK